MSDDNEELHPAVKYYNERLEYYRNNGTWRAAWWCEEMKGMRYYDRDKDNPPKPALLKLKVEVLE